MFDDDKFYFTSDPALLALVPYSTMAHWRFRRARACPTSKLARASRTAAGL